MADKARVPLFFFSSFNLAFGLLVMAGAGLMLEAGCIAPGFVVLLGFHIVALQVGQTVGFQVATGSRVSEVLVTRVLLGSFLAASIALAFAWGLPQAHREIGPILVTLASVGSGLIHGMVGAKELLSHGRLAFQRHLFRRNLSVGAALIFAIGMFEDELWAMTAAPVLCLVFALGARNGSSDSPACAGETVRRPAHASTLTLGVLASLLYRNDVNVVRLAVGNSENFLALHYGLTLYSALVAFAGFLVANFLYPKLHDARPSLESLIPKFRTFVLVLVVPALLALSGERYMTVVVMLIPLAGLLGPIASAFLHSEGRSRFVYLSGASWFCLVLLSPVLLLGGGVDVFKHFLGYLLIVVLTLAAGMKARAAGA